MAGWIKKLMRKDRPDAPQDTVLTASQASRGKLMNLDQERAVQAHLDWHKRLRDVVHGESQEELDAQAVSVGSSCLLGKWIDNAGQANYGHLSAFQDLRAKHTAFHELAGQIVQNAQDGQRVEAKRQLIGPLPQLFQEVLDALERLSVQAAEDWDIQSGL